MLFGSLTIAAAAIALPKVVALSVEPVVWACSWLLGSVAAGFAGALVWTATSRHSILDSAIELDRRYGLGERVSSALDLGSSEPDSDASRALVGDARRAVRRIDLRQRFEISPGRRILLPVLPAVLAVCLALLVTDKVARQSAGAAAPAATEAQVNTSARVLKRRLAERREQAESKGLKDAEHLFRELEKGVQDLAEKPAIDRKRALVKLNDLARKLERRRDQLGGDDAVRRQLQQLKTVARGPADRLAESLRRGDFRQAIDQLQELAEQLRTGKLDDAARAQLAEQIKQIGDRLGQLADAHRQAVAELKDRLDQARKTGQLDQASELQQLLDKLQRQAPQMDQLDRLARDLGAGAKSLSQGDAAGALARLADLAADLDALQKSLDELEMLQNAMTQVAECKAAMACGL